MPTKVNSLKVSPCCTAGLIRSKTPAVSGVESLKFDVAKQMALEGPETLGNIGFMPNLISEMVPHYTTGYGLMKVGK